MVASANSSNNGVQIEMLSGPHPLRLPTPRPDVCPWTPSLDIPSYKPWSTVQYILVTAKLHGFPFNLVRLHVLTRAALPNVKVSKIMENNTLLSVRLGRNIAWIIVQCIIALRNPWDQNSTAAPRQTRQNPSKVPWLSPIKPIKESRCEFIALGNQA